MTNKARCILVKTHPDDEDTYKDTNDHPEQIQNSLIPKFTECTKENVSDHISPALNALIHEICGTNICIVNRAVISPQIVRMPTKRHSTIRRFFNVHTVVKKEVVNVHPVVKKQEKKEVVNVHPVVKKQEKKQVVNVHPFNQFFNVPLCKETDQGEQTQSTYIAFSYIFETFSRYNVAGNFSRT